MIAQRAVVLRALTSGPRKYADMAGPDHQREQRAKMRKLVDKLKSEGTVKQVYIDRFPYLALADWAPSDEQTLAILEGRGKRTVDGCLLWNEYIHPKRGPTSRLGNTVPMPVRRTIWQIKRGPVDAFETIKATCGHPACIEYTHMVLEKRANAFIGRKLTTLHKKKIAEKRRSRPESKMDWEKVRELRASNDPCRVLAARYGIGFSTAAAIKRGDLWKEVNTGMFTDLIRAAV